MMGRRENGSMLRALLSRFEVEDWVDRLRILYAFVSLNS